MQGEYRGIPFIACNADLGHWCGYIRLPDGHPYCKFIDKKRWFSIGSRRFYYSDYSKIPLDCHGGITFGRKVKAKEKWPQGFTDGYWIGWDYAHAGDYLPPSDHFGGLSGREWFEDDVVRECKTVIDQLLGVTK